MRALIVAIAGIAGMAILFAWCSSDLATQGRTAALSSSTAAASSSLPPAPAPIVPARPSLRVEGLPALESGVPISEASSSTKPPAGDTLSLGLQGIRWCLFQKERLDAARETAPSFGEAAFDRFNDLVTDYNARCGRFRYYERDMNTATTEAAVMRDALQVQGRAMARGQRGDPRQAMGRGSTEYRLDPVLLRAIADVARAAPLRCGRDRVGPLLASNSAISEAGVYDVLDRDQVVLASARQLRQFTNRLDGDTALALAAYCLDRVPEGDTVVPPDTERFVREVAARYVVLSKIGGR